MAARKLAVSRLVRFVSLGQVRNGWMRGHPSGFVVMDEIVPLEWMSIRDELKFQEVVAAYWTNR